MVYAPIIIFAFNRFDSLKHTVDSLLRNSEAKDSDLFVFVDGARPTKKEESDKVRDVQEYVKSITGFKNVKWHFSEKNKGLGPSVIGGVNEVINQYGKAIVVEDDLICSENFLSFMNQGLDRYESEEKVFSICGYTNKVKCPEDYAADSYFSTRSSSWGWATWIDRWNSVDWELKNWSDYTKHAKAFNKWGGSDCWKMLNDWHNGKNRSWAIRFCFAQFMQDKLSLFPIKSFVQNDGFDGQGTNCKKWSRFKYEMISPEQKLFKWPNKIEIHQELYKEAMSYNSICIRLWSKLMYAIIR